MRGPEGGFYSAQDADCEGEEGKFYVWTPDEIRAVLGETGDDANCINFPSQQARFDAVLRRHARAGTSRGATSCTSPAAPTPPSRRACERDAAGALRGAREARLAGARRQAPDRLERADDRRLGRGRRRAWARGLPRGGAHLRRVRLERPARRRRRPAAHLQGRPRPPQGLPGGPRLPARGPAHPLRSDLRDRAGSSAPASSPTPCSPASPTPSAAASSPPPTTTNR